MKTTDEILNKIKNKENLLFVFDYSTYLNKNITLLNPTFERVYKNFAKKSFIEVIVLKTKMARKQKKLLKDCENYNLIYFGDNKTLVEELKDCINKTIVGIRPMDELEQKEVAFTISQPQLETFLINTNNVYL